MTTKNKSKELAELIYDKLQHNEVTSFQYGDLTIYIDDLSAYTRIPSIILVKKDFETLGEMANMASNLLIEFYENSEFDWDTDIVELQLNIGFAARGWDKPYSIGFWPLDIQNRIIDQFNQKSEDGYMVTYAILRLTDYLS